MPERPEPTYDPCNEIHLIGRVTADPDVTVLPSGDELVKVKISVPRPRPPAGSGKRTESDPVTCTAWEGPIRRRVRVWCKDDIVDVKGALRRRVWKREGDVRFVYEVELAEVTLIRPMTTRTPTPDGGQHPDADPDRHQVGDLHASSA